MIDTSRPSNEVITRTTSFLQDDDIGLFFVSRVTHRAYACVAASVFVVAVCAILLIV